MFKFVLHRKTLISMVFIGLALLGLISYNQLPVELYPNAELPFLIVQVSAMQDVSPEYLEKQAIIPLEAVVSTLEGVDEIESIAMQRRGTITIYFKQSVKIKYAYLRLEEKINNIKDDFSDEFQIQVIKVDTEMLTNTFMEIQARGSGGVERVREFVDRKIVDKLGAVDGIANVNVSGGKQKSVEVILDKDVCDANDITVAQIRNLIVQYNQQKTYVGEVRESDRNYFVNVIADYQAVNQLEDIVINKNGPILLKDVAQVYFGSKEPESISRVNGKDAVTLQLIRDSQANLIELAQQTRKAVAEINKEFVGNDVELIIQQDSAEEIEKNINMIIQLAVFGGLLAVLVLWYFLRNFRLVLIITLAIPISLFTSFNLFYAFDISINSITLVGMALAVGMLLDNSIVVLENIYRLYARKIKLSEAILQGTREVWRSVMAATLTTITIFLPFSFASDFVTKLLGRHVGVSIVSTLVVSLIVALFLIPMLAHLILRGAKSPKEFNVVSQKNRLMSIYNLFLKFSIRYPVRTILIALVGFFASLIICLALSINVPEEVETTQFDIYVTMPTGSTLERTDAVVQKVEENLMDLEEKEDIISNIYEEEAVVTVKLKEDFTKIANRNIPEIKDQIQDERLRNIRAAEISFEEPESSQRFGGGGGGMGGRNPMGNMERAFGIGTASEYVLIKGHDFDKMRILAEDVEDYLETITSINNTWSSMPDDRPEMHVHFDSDLMTHYQIGVNSVQQEFAAFQREFSANTSFKQGTEEYDVIIKTDTVQIDKTEEDLKKLRIPSQSGGLHELQQISRIVYDEGISRVSRVNQEKQIEVRYRFQNEVTDSKDMLNAARLEVDNLIENINVPSGIAMQVVHDENDLNEYYLLIAAAFILIYMILASVFESLSLPVIMMFTIPLAGIGSLWGLILTGNSILNANTMIGFLILLGVVVNNGIIFIDYTRILRGRGYTRSRALMMAGQARVRPILITALTTIIGMLPLAMGKAEYVGQIGAPFAITVIGGLAFSTVFTLVFIPTVYSGLETAIDWFKRLNWKLQVLQYAAWALGGWLIYDTVNNWIWKFADWMLLLFLVPGTLWFIMSSLRRANEKYIDENEPLHIKIQHIVKIYDDKSRFVKGWIKGKEIHEKAADVRYETWRDLKALEWGIPIAAFLAYFVYFYLESGFWVFVFMHAIYFMLLFMVNQVKKLVDNKWVTLAYKLAFWGFPALNVLWLYMRFKSIAGSVFVAILWYFALAVYTTSNKLLKENINIVRITGKLTGIRRWFYSLVQVIPVIGKKKVAFRALDGVSLEIGNGMFGLLGPNGAGKTTIMRIICGILEQTRGRIWINGIGLHEKREELQGLIGYLPQEFGMYENLSAYEFLDYQAILKNLTDEKERHERIMYVLKAVHMDENKDKPIGSFSGGMKQRIGIAQTLLHLPRILVVDEPTAGLDPRERIRFRNLLVELSRERIIIFSTHIIEDISSSCNRVAVMNRGVLKYLGEPLEMVKIADGKVWQFLVPAKEFEEWNKKIWIVHHIRVEDKIRIRCLVDEQPHAEAKPVKPTLEDAYLWLIRGVK